MPWMENNDVSGKKRSPPQDESWSGDMKIADLFQMLCELIDSRFDQQEKMLDSCFDQQERKLDEIMKMREEQVSVKQAWSMMLGNHVFPWRQTGLQTRKFASARRAPPLQYKRCMGIAVLHKSVQDGPKTSTSFGVKTEPPDLPCREDVLVKNGAASPKSCLPSSEMHSPTAAGGLLPTGEASTATRATFKQPPLRFHSTEETDSKTI